MTALPATMPAVRLHAWGGPEGLRFEDAPLPVPGPRQVLIRAGHAGLNPVDWKVRGGGVFAERMGQPLPLILGWDTAGDIVAVGEGVTRFVVGDRVGGMPHFPKYAACYAAYVAADETDVERIPDSVSTAEAAAVPLAGLTAEQLLDALALPAGSTLLVQAASGGVGHLAVQLAKHRGLRVVATCSTRNVPFVQLLGADVVIDYTVAPLTAQIGEVDGVLDPFGGAAQTAAVALVRNGGAMVTIVGMAPDTVTAAAAKDVRFTGILVHPDSAQLASLYAKLGDGRLRVHVGASFPLAEAAAAQTFSQTARAVGKIVLEMPA